MKEWEVASSEDPFSYSNPFPQASYLQKVCPMSSLAFSTLEESHTANDNTESFSTAGNACLISSEFLQSYDYCYLEGG